MAATIVILFAVFGPLVLILGKLVGVFVDEFKCRHVFDWLHDEIREAIDECDEALW